MEEQATSNSLGQAAMSAASPMASKTSKTPRASFSGGHLPDLVLDLVLGYLDDESDDRRDLWSFSLACRRYCEVADRRRFRQIVVAVPSFDMVDEAAVQLRTILSHGRRYAFVHRLRLQGLKGPSEHDEHGSRREGEPPSVLDRESDPVFESVHPFCRIRESTPWFIDDDSSPDYWQQFASLLCDLPALHDLVWPLSSISSIVLDAVHFQRTRRCRLHMSAFGFKLQSLVYDRDHPESISAHDYALMTSPSLCSVSARMHPFNSDGSLDYNDHALRLMMAGLAPNLANVWISHTYMGHTIDLHFAYQRGRPDFPGLFIGDDKDDGAEGKSNSVGVPLEHVRFDVGMHIYESWNTSKLRRLHIRWSDGAGLALANLALRGGLASVETLWLTSMETESKSERLALQDIVGHIAPLRELRLTGNVTNAIFDTVLRHHSATIRSLYLEPGHEDDFEEEDDNDDSNQLLDWSPERIQRLAESCHLLEAVFVKVARTRGDRSEVAMYRLLSTLPHLKHLMLKLMCPLDMRGPNGVERYQNHIGITAESHKITFTNAAVDAMLARAIFNVISREGQGRLQTLHLIPDFHVMVHTSYVAAVRLLTLPWACTRQANGDVVVEAIHKRETQNSIKRCSRMIENNKLCYKGQEDTYPYVFMELWPGNEPWWEGWTSLPLDLS